MDSKRTCAGAGRQGLFEEANAFDAPASPRLYYAPVRNSETGTMRLGGPVFETFDDPDAWDAALGQLGYRAAYCPADEYALAAAYLRGVASEIGAAL